MTPADWLTLGLGLGAFGFIGLFALALCQIAGMADEDMAGMVDPFWPDMTYEGPWSDDVRIPRIDA